MDEFVIIDPKDIFVNSMNPYRQILINLIINLISCVCSPMKNLHDIMILMCKFNEIKKFKII